MAQFPRWRGKSQAGTFPKQSVHRKLELKHRGGEVRKKGKK